METKIQNSDETATSVSFHKINDNTGEVIAVRNGKTYSIQLVALTQESVEKLNKLKREVFGKNPVVAP